ncbi:hypothetical protein OVY48_09990 [Sphingobium sp. SA2]|uniref:helix-turn-helix domain-containing protein n=1 Tax=Sphingobium sp. SA2 TaxID=1524832 RepID=UPI0028C0C76E|nr:helix-turn-helix domain-containing protein [Sphingobium sp. SA2]MDT7533754.1 hypothetical protein [Sphingobium sp. SA2]
MRVALSPADAQVIRLMTARMALRVPRPVGGRVRVADIIDQVAYEMGLHRCDLCGADRRSVLFRGRAAICWLARQLTPASFPQLGAMLGGRDHSSAHHAYCRALEMRERDPAFHRLTDRILTHFRDLEED